MPHPQSAFLARLALCCALVALPAAASAQACAYDFNALAGSDAHPYTPLSGQDGWSTESFGTAVELGLTATLGFDGSPALHFQESGPGYGADASRLNDGAFSFPAFDGTETDAVLQADFRVGFWGGSLALAFDKSGDGKVRGSQAGEIGPRLLVGSNDAPAGLAIVSAAGTKTQVPLSTVPGASGGKWLRLRLRMDLTANGGKGTGSLEAMNLSAGDTAFQPVAGLSGVDLELSPGAADAADPTTWHGVWLHFEGATYQLDNLRADRSALPFTLCGSVPSASLAQGGTQELRLDAGPAHAGDTYLLLGTLSGTTPGISAGAHLLPLNVDPYFLLTLSAPNQPPLGASLAALDAAGRATATFTVPPGSNPAWAGAVFHHAYITFDLVGPTVTLASDAVPLALAP